MTAPNDDRRDAGHDGVAHERAEYEGAEYDGMDALMAALLDEPLPEEALQDAAFMTAHREAAADVALLREQLGLLGDALARVEAGTEEEAGAESEAGSPAGRGRAARTEAGTRPAPGAGSETTPVPSVRPLPARSDSEAGTAGSGAGPEATAVSPVRPLPVRSGDEVRPGGEVGSEADARSEGGPELPEADALSEGRSQGAAVPPVTPLAARSRRVRRRSLSVAVGVLAVACAGAVVSGMGWLIAQGGGAGADAGAGTSSQADSKEASGTAFGSPRYLACARLVVEGTVASVEAVPGGGQDRVTLAVTRSYKPEQKQEEVTFVREDGVHPRLRAGDKVLVGMPRHGVVPDALFLGEKDIAPERAWITASLPEARTLTCT